VTQRYLFEHEHAPGDITAMTAFVRDLHLSHPGEFETDVRTPFMALWQHNPYITRFDEAGRKAAKKLRLCYGAGIKKAATHSIHFLAAWHEFFKSRTGIDVPLLYPKPDLHLSELEKSHRLVQGRYWLLMAGGKMDFTTKHWVFSRYQQVVNVLAQLGIHCVQAGATGGRPANYHPPLEGVTNLVGKTDFRQFLRLVYHADGVICPITFAMHVAAAFDRPCVTVAGGREEWWWEAYHEANTGFGPRLRENVRVSHRYLHTLGQLKCCASKGCWKNKVVKTEKDNNRSFCVLTTKAENKQVVPECMARITVEHVVEAVMHYYAKGILPPIGPVPIITLPDGQALAKDRQPGEAPAWSGDPLAPARPGKLPQAPKPVRAAKTARTPTPEIHPPAMAEVPRPDASSIFDHPLIGGRFTICVLMYGKYHALHRKCLDSILATTPPDRVDIRVGSNEVCAETDAYLDKLLADGAIQARYAHEENRKKYPVMREMFHDPARPLRDWVIWFDDDTICDRNQEWLTLLAMEIVRYRPSNYHMYGPVRFYVLQERQKAWIKKAAWYKKRQFRDTAGRPAPNGNKVHFASGSFWCLSREAILGADIPDARLGHNGGDVLIGEQLWQSGYRLRSYSSKKELVHWSSVPRRGLSEKHFGL
jgi:ADP-heptose:LPS heptosyltransferase